MQPLEHELIVPPVLLPPGVTAAHEDTDLLVLHKPAGLLCVPGRGPDKQDCLSARAQQQWPGALVVHRLDQATSGLVLMARNVDVQRQLSQAFAERRVYKRYEAVVQGLLSASAATRSAPPDGTPGWHLIDLPIAADWERRPLRVVDPVHGKPSQTRWRIQAWDPSNGTTRVELEPLTGRTHQLRVHMAATGHPIAGDALYGDTSAQALSQRLLLHACSLAFEHPGTGVPLSFDWPTEF